MGRVAEVFFEYDSFDRVTAFTDGNGNREGRVASFTYDKAGNLLCDDRAKYEYDAFHRNTKVESFDGNIQINRYDSEGLRHEMEENGRLVSFLFHGEDVVVEETKEEKIRYIRTRELLASDAESARTYYHYASDEMGSITHVIAEEKMLNHYEYDAWGNPTVSEEKIENRFKFNGQQLDPVSRQYYLRARFYNPVIGRFTQEDSYRGDGLNLYTYCANNPVYYVDPSGHICAPAAQRITEKLENHQATRKEQKKLAAYLRHKERNGGLTDAERNTLNQIDSYTYLPRYENQTLPWRSDTSTIHNDILDSPRTGSALKVDKIKPTYTVDPKTGRTYMVQEFPAGAQAHGFNNIVDNYAGYVTKTSIENGVLYQLEGSLNGVSGRFEWIIQNGQVTHRMFIQNGTMNGVPIKP